MIVLVFVFVNVLMNALVLVVVVNFYVYQDYQKQLVEVEQRSQFLFRLELDEWYVDFLFDENTLHEMFFH